jgi:Peptidase family S41
MRRLALAAALLQSPAASRAIEPSCVETFNWIVTQVERNYAGFTYKVTPATRQAYNAHTDSVRIVAAGAQGLSPCHNALVAWIAFFRDGHLAVNRRPTAADSAVAVAPDDTLAIVRRFASAPSRMLSEVAATASIMSPRPHDPIEGIWEAVDANYRLAVVPDSAKQGGFVAIVLRADGVWWRPGQIKAWITPVGERVYDVRYLRRDHQETRGQGIRLKANVAAMPLNAVWLRVTPQRRGDLRMTEYLAGQNTSIRLDVISRETAVLHLPSFDLRGAATIDSMVARNRALLERTPNLILDLRGNGGGSDFAYASLIPLLYTRPIVSAGTSFWASESHIAKYEDFLASGELNADQRVFVRAIVDSLKAHPGAFYTLPSDTVRMDSVRTFPRRVGVLVDRGCASSCEEFVLGARQSSKVTLFGSRTAGVLDFSNVNDFLSPGGVFELHCPSSRSSRLPASPVDPDGIAVQRAILADEVDVLGWIARQLSGKRR